MNVIDRIKPSLFPALWMMAFTWPLIAHADPSTPAPYGRYQISGVAAGDSLDIRKWGASDGPLLGKVASGTDGIMVSGIWEKRDGDIWWELIPSPTNPVAGWVNSRYLTITRAQREADHDYPLACGGSEPFWSLDIAEGKARFDIDGSGEPEETWTASEWIAPEGSSLWTFAVRLSAGWSKGYAAIKEEEVCSEGGDRNLPFYLMLIDPTGNVFTGCCSRR
jgi:hypothetical protein